MPHRSTTELLDLFDATHQEGFRMVELLQSYGLWIALGVVFLAMHWFGMCCFSQPPGRGVGRKSSVVSAGGGNTEKGSEA
jgi:hypothetical protein